jgi:hypothetical protein
MRRGFLLRAYLRYTVAMRRTLRNLRIAVTALSLTACVLLIALWVRSYWVQDIVTVRPTATRTLTLHSIMGRIELSTEPRVMRRFAIVTHWEYDEVPPSTDYTFGFRREYVVNDDGALGWLRGHRYTVAFPHWLFITTMATLVAIPWLPWRFSLRTLLIATTLFAVGLAIIVLLS